MADKIVLDEDQIYQSEQYQELFMDNLGLQEEVARLENLVDEYESSAVTIYDIDDFMYRLRMDGLLTPQLEDFISNYMKYYNQVFNYKDIYNP